MSMNRTATVFLGAALVAFAIGCGGQHDSGPPPTNVDRTTPVIQLTGWSELVTSIGLTAPQTDTFADWVLVFRDGLDISRRNATEPERLQSEADWWAEAEHELPGIVGAANVARVIAWLEMLYGHRRAS